MAVFGKVLLYTIVMMGMLNVVNQAPSLRDSAHSSTCCARTIS